MTKPTIADCITEFTRLHTHHAAAAKTLRIGVANTRAKDVRATGEKVLTEQQRLADVYALAIGIMKEHEEESR